MKNFISLDEVEKYKLNEAYKVLHSKMNTPSKMRSLIQKNPDLQKKLSLCKAYICTIVASSN